MTPPPSPAGRARPVALGGADRMVARALGLVMKLPIHAYRYSLKAFVGFHCRHLPTCSEYALEAIDRNGPWRGGWLMVSRLWRCRPGGTSGYDPVPDLTAQSHPLAPWRYGRWRRVCCPGCARPTDGALPHDAPAHGTAVKLPPA